MVKIAASNCPVIKFRKVGNNYIYIYMYIYIYNYKYYFFHPFIVLRYRTFHIPVDEV